MITHVKYIKEGSQTGLTNQQQAIRGFVSKMQGQLKPFSKSDHENVGFMVPSFSDMDNKKNGKTMRMSDTPNNEPPPIFP